MSNLQKLIASCLGLVLVGCTSMQMLPRTEPMCDPTPPKIEWYEAQDGGVYYTRTGAGELLNYIHDLKECIEQMQR